MDSEISSGHFEINVSSGTFTINTINPVEIYLCPSEHETRDLLGGVLISKIGGQKPVYIAPKSGTNLVTKSGNPVDILIIGIRKSVHKIYLEYDRDTNTWYERIPIH